MGSVLEGMVEGSIIGGVVETSGGVVETSGGGVVKTSGGGVVETSGGGVVESSGGAAVEETAAGVDTATGVVDTAAHITVNSSLSNYLLKISKHCTILDKDVNYNNIYQSQNTHYPRAQASRVM